MDAGYAWKLSKFGRLTSTRLRFDDDFSDRLNYQFTGLLLFIFIGIIGIRQYTGKPIQCWTPQEFTRGWEEYAENYCWVASTFFVRSWVTQPDNKISNVHGRSDNGEQSLNKPNEPSMYQTIEKPKSENIMNEKYSQRYLPSETDPSAQKSSMQLVQVENTKVNLRSMLSYYQWAPILLAIQALFFYIPCLIWRLFSSRSGLHLKRIMQLASEANQAVPTEAEVTQADVEAAKQVVLNRSDSLSSLTKPKKSQQVFNSSKAIKTLARYIDASLQRQIDLRSIRQRQKFYSDLYAKENRNRRFSNHHPAKENICEKFCCFYKKCFHSFSLSRRQKHRQFSKRGLTSNEGETEKISTNERLRMNDSFEKAGCTFCSCECFSSGSWLVGLYFFMKILYLSNVIGQMYVMQLYTGVKYNFYGLRVLYDLACGVEWEQSGHFPRVTFCEFEAVKFSVNYRYVLQCVLPMNLFLEKIYIFLWLWFLVIGLLTFTTLIYWISRVGTKKCRFTWIHNQLLTLRVQHPSVVVTSSFIEDYLGPDGVFLLKLISTNYGELIVGDLVGELWFLYRQRKLAVQGYTPQTNLNQKKPTLPSKTPIKPMAKRLSDIKPSPIKKSEYTKKLLSNFKPGQKVTLDMILKAHHALRGENPENLLKSGKSSELMSRGNPKFDPNSKSVQNKLSVLGIDLAMNRDQLRHPAEWLAMLHAQQYADFGVSSASSSSGKHNMRSNLEIRGAPVITNQATNQRNQSPPPVPERNIDSRGSNSVSHNSDQFDPDRTQALGYQAELDNVASYFDDLNNPNELNDLDRNDLNQDTDFQYMPVDQVEFQQIGEVNYNDMNIQDGTGMELNDEQNDDMMNNEFEQDGMGLDDFDRDDAMFGNDDDNFDMRDDDLNDDMDSRNGGNGMDENIV